MFNSEISMAVRSLTFSAALFLSTFPVFTIFVAMTVGQPAVESTTRKYWVYVGTYTGKDSKGIYAYRFDSESGTMAAIGLAVEIENPSFLAVHPSGRYLYAANELDRFDGKPGGAVTAFSIDSTTGRLHLLNQVPSKGAGPTHILLDHTGKYAFVANYSGGSVVVFAIGEDGRIRKATAFIHSWSIISFWVNVSPQSASQTGKQAAELLLAQIASKRSLRPRRILLSPKLVIRESTHRILEHVR